MAKLLYASCFNIMLRIVSSSGMAISSPEKHSQDLSTLSGETASALVQH